MGIGNIIHSLKTGSDLLNELISDKERIEIIERISKTTASSLKSGGKVIICGNGGSMTDAMHFAEELTGRFRKDRKALAAIALSDPSFITCAANDFGFSQVFARGVEAFGNEGDIFIGLSTSGNSENIINALDRAEKNKLKTVLLLGKDGGKLKDKAHQQIVIRGGTSDRIQELHMFILHIMVEEIERELFPENYQH